MYREPLGAEDLLVLLLAQGDVSSQQEEQVLALLNAPLDWDLMLHRIRVHEVYPLCYRNLTRLGFPYVPRQIQAELKALVQGNAFRSYQLADELAQILTLFASADIPAIPLKGITLAEMLYEDPTLRASVDMDVLIPRAKVKEAVHLLSGHGYITEIAGRFFSEVVLKNNIEWMLVRETTWPSYAVELHWGIWLGGSFECGSTDDLWTEAYPTVFRGVPIYTLSPEWHLLFLSVHTSRHSWQGLKWLVDIHTFCCQNEINWDRVWNKAQLFGWEEIIRVTLETCQMLFKTPVQVPEGETSFPSWLRVYPHDPTFGSMGGMTVVLRLLRRPSEKLRYLCRTFFIPTLAEQRVVQLPSALGFVYYLLRPVRLGYKAGAELVSKCVQRLQWRT